MIVYADLYVLMNFAANRLLLGLVGGREKGSGKRRTAGALAGSLMALLTFGIKSGILRFLLSVLIGLTMDAIAFPGGTKKRRLCRILMLYGYGFLLSGFVRTFCEWIFFHGHARTGAAFAVLLWCLLLLLCRLGLFLFHRGFGNARSLKALLTVEIGFKGEVFRLVGLMDTGNRLREPVTGASVVIVEEREVWSMSNLVRKNVRLYPIVCRSLGSDSCCLFGFRPDFVRIQGELCPNVLVAAWNGRLDPKGQYEAILPPRTSLF